MLTFPLCKFPCSFPERSHPHSRHVEREASVGIRTELLTKQHAARAGRQLQIRYGSCVTNTYFNVDFHSLVLLRSTMRAAWSTRGN